MSYNVMPSTAATSNRSPPGKPNIFSSRIYSMPQSRAIMNKTADSNGNRGSFDLPRLPEKSHPMIGLRRPARMGVAWPRTLIWSEPEASPPPRLAWPDRAFL